MSVRDLLWTATQSIRSNKLRSALTTLGVIIGVLSVTLFVSIGEAMRQYLMNSLAGLGSNSLQVVAGKRETQGFGAPPLNTVRKLTYEDAKYVKRRALSVLGVSSIVQGGGTSRYLNRRRDTFIFGVEPDFSDIREIRVDQGRFFSNEDIQSHRRCVVIGRTVALELFGLQENPIGKRLNVADMQLQVIGLTERKGTTLGFDLDDLVFVPVTTAMDMFAMEEVTNIVARAKSKIDVDSTKDEITEILKFRHNNKVDFTIVSQDDILTTVNGIMGTMKTVLLFIASISLVVGGIGIANIMLVSVRERTREIGVRRAVGATKRQILLQFLLESILISLLGGAVGLGLGAIIIFGTKAAKPDLPLTLSIEVVMVAFFFSLLVGVFSGVIPARKAAQLDPVEALRYE